MIDYLKFINKSFENTFLLLLINQETPDSELIALFKENNQRDGVFAIIVKKYHVFIHSC